MKKYTLHELQLYLQRVISLNFAQPVWVTAEVSHVNHSRGHVYLELVQKHPGEQDHGEVCAQSQGVIWAKNLQKIASSLPVKIDELLEAGRELNMLVDVTFHPVYGLKLSVLDIDYNYTLGQIALLRQQTLERLKNERLLDRNRQLEWPLVVQRVAVISSSTAAGYQDFIRHLHENDYGYHFETVLFQSALQGGKLVKEVLQGLDKINSTHSEFDCIVIIRGGGSKLDLAGFDEYEVAKAISQSTLPVVTGIGHEVDQTIADLVAHTALKTPTAVANYLIDVNATFESRIQQLDLDIQRHISRLHNRAIDSLKYAWQAVCAAGLKQIQLEAQGLANKLKAIQAARDHTLARERLRLAHLNEKIEILHPEAMFNRGYSLTFIKKHPLQSIVQLEIGQVITSRLKDGTIQSRIESIETL